MEELRNDHSRRISCAVTATGERLCDGWFPPDRDRRGRPDRAVTPQTALAIEAITPTWHFADGVAAAAGELRIVDQLKRNSKPAYAAKTKPPEGAAAGRCVTARQRRRHLPAAGHPRHTSLHHATSSRVNPTALLSLCGPDVNHLNA